MATNKRPILPAKRRLAVSQDEAEQITVGFPKPSHSRNWFDWIAEVHRFRGLTRKTVAPLMQPFRWSNSFVKDLEVGDRKLCVDEYIKWLAVMQVPNASIPSSEFIPLAPKESPLVKARLPYSDLSVCPPAVVVEKVEDACPPVKKDARTQAVLAKGQRKQGVPLSKLSSKLTWGNFLRQARLDKDTTLEKVSTFLGIHSSTLSRVELENATFSSDNLRRWKQFMGITVTPIAIPVWDGAHATPAVAVSGIPAEVTQMKPVASEAPAPLQGREAHIAGTVKLLRSVRITDAEAKLLCDMVRDCRRSLIDADEE